MRTYILRRVLTAIPTLFIISIVIFTILAAAPGDPLSQLALNPEVPPEVRENLRRALGLDDPWHIRYIKWVWSMAKGEFGYSFSSHIPVVELVKQRLPNTLAVVGIAYLIAALFALPIGVLSAVRQYSFFDQAATTFAFIGVCAPTFFTGLLFILIFSVKLQWFPFIYDTTLKIEDFDSLLKQIKQSIMPISVLALFQMGQLTRFTRASVLENLPMDYVRTAWAKGLPERAVVFRHVFPNSLIPVVTLIALSIPNIFAGAIITEQIFRVNGIGELLITSTLNNDTPVVMGLTFIYSVLVVLFNLVADIIYGFLDPRIAYE
ncbi:MAG: ABC transporter permease [Chloroflexi bacterium]|nr:ABC transporter permease [Chloroflexota bacterium]